MRSNARAFNQQPAFKEHKAREDESLRKTGGATPCHQDGDSISLFSHLPRAPRTPSRISEEPNVCRCSQARSATAQTSGSPHVRDSQLHHSIPPLALASPDPTETKSLFRRRCAHTPRESPLSLGRKISETCHQRLRHDRSERDILRAMRRLAPIVLLQRCAPARRSHQADRVDQEYSFFLATSAITHDRKRRTSCRAEREARSMTL